jgi:uncharacterized protein YndB with AHSA1/START domain
MAETTAVTVHIDAAPEHVYELISDVTRMGEWSPECVRCVWQDGATGPAAGARFRGSNRQGLLKWSTTAEIVAADPGREFAFTTKTGKRDSTRWRYVLTAAGEGTDLTESYESVYMPAMVKLGERLFMRNREQQLEDGMRTTLERVKTAAERPPGAS